MTSVKKLLVILFLLSILLETETAFNSGRDFILLYPEIKGVSGTRVLGTYLTGQTSPVQVSVVESGSSGGTVGFFDTNAFKDFAVSNTVYGSGLFPHMVRLTTDVNVTAFGVSHAVDRGDLYSAIPVSALGTDHYTVTYCEVANQPCQIDIASLLPGTNVTVSLPYGPSNVTVDFMGTTYTNGDTFMINLDQNEVAQIQSKSDLTGTRITSTANVAVYSGSTGTTIQGSTEGFLLKPMPPVTTWGKQYVAVPTPGRTLTGDYYRIITSESNTVVTVSGESPVHLPNTGQWIQRNFSNDQTRRITSDKPIMVVRLSLSEKLPTEPGYPTMVVLIPNEQFVKGTDVFVPKVSETTWNVITIVTKAKNTPGMLSEATPITNWVSVEGSAYQTAEVTVTQEYNKISSTDATAEFAVYFYGHGSMSNAYIGGRNYANINPPCTPTTMSIGDEVDNDCDGQTDEDTCTPTDFAGKDCAVIVSGTRDVYGIEFVFAFPFHVDDALQYVYLTSQLTLVTVTLEEPNGAGVLQTQVLIGNNHLFSIPSSQQIQNSDFSNKTLKLTATSEITAFALSTEVTQELTAGAFRMLPVDTLGREYFAATYCEDNMCFITISAVHPDTNVEVQLTLKDSSNVTYSGTIYQDGDTIHIGLAQYETAQVLADVDITGSKIISNKPISVITGGQFTKVKKGGNIKDMVIEQLVPVQALGHQSAFVQSPTRLTHTGACSTGDCRDYIRIVATQDSTVFNLTMEGSTTEYSFDFQGMFQDIELIDMGVIESDKPVQIVQLLTQGPITFDGGMVLVVPVEQYSSGEDLLIPAGADIGQGSDLNEISVLVITNQTDTGDILHDGNTFAPWQNLPALKLATAYASITKGERQITCSANSMIGGHISSNLQQYPPATFTFPLAFKLININQPCKMTSSEPGDGEDNDCDGLIDEENCTSVIPEDEDYDGMFDEDCQYYTVVSSSIVPTSTVLYQSSSDIPFTTQVFSSQENSTPLPTIDASTSIPIQFSPPHFSPSTSPASGQTSSVQESLSISSTLVGPSITDSQPPINPSETPLTTPIVASVPEYLSSSSYLVVSSISASQPPIISSETPLTTSIAASVPAASASINPSPTVTKSISSHQESSAAPAPESTTVPAATSHSCTCICSSLTALDQGSLTEVVASIRKELIVDKETVSQAIRKKTSAPDDRPSAVSMGYVGVAVISSLFVGIFILDAGSLFRDTISLCKSLKDACKPKTESKA